MRGGGKNQGRTRVSMNRSVREALQQSPRNSTCRDSRVLNLPQKNLTCYAEAFAFESLNKYS